ncbi:MAG: TRAP transporter large permease [Candidatus Amoebophilus sp.]
MDWWIVISLLFGSLIIIMATGLPVAFSFLLVDFIAMLLLVGHNAPDQLIGSIFDSLTKFTLTPIPLFVLMGEVLFHSGLAKRLLDAMDTLLGRLPGRLGVLAIISGTIFASLSGSVVANTVLLGSLLLPEMVERKYNPRFAIGSIMASGSLTMMMPHSTLIIIFATIAMIPVGSLLVAGTIPGLFIATFYFIYTVGISWLKPNLAPKPVVQSDKIKKNGLFVFFFDVLPLVAVILATILVIVFGVATPTEAAALGAVCSIILVILYGKFTLEVIKKSAANTIYMSAMLLFIVAGSTGFSQVLAFSGASRGLLEAVLGLNMSPTMLVISMLIIVFFIAMFMEEAAIIMITTPIFMPVIKAMHVNPIWFGVLMLMMLEKGLITPPAGLLLFVAKGIAPEGITTWDIWMATIPYVLCILAAIVLVFIFPQIALVLVK